MTLNFDLNTVWFILVGVLFTGYVMLDGFDLGVGALHLFVKEDHDRRIFLNAIGPVWDGNEVWLVTGGGALFAAFPGVYATVFSGFYLAFMLLLFFLIFRAVAIEFRSKHESPRWRRTWDALFAMGSVGAALLIGVALGNIARGIPIGPDGEYRGTFLGLLNPYSLLVGATTVALFAMHGCIYLVLKTEGELQARVRGFIRPTIALFIVGYVATTIATLLHVPHMTAAFKAQPALAAIPVLNLLAVANIPREAYHGRELRAFLSSCAAMGALMLLFGLGMYPHMVESRPIAEHSLTIYNSASSPKTLKIMLIIAACGIPLVLAYTASIYWVFRGKVKLDSTSY
jgi:cytochrome d ubiquinol oxidase subunit II